MYYLDFNYFSKYICYSSIMLFKEAS